MHLDNQGKCLAIALVQSGIDQVRKLELDIFILAFKAGLIVYKRLGFRIENQSIQDDSMYGGKGEYGVYFMIYDHASAK